MTRKHFTLIAETLKASTVTANLTETQREDLSYEFGKLCRTFNPRFDSARFFGACGIEVDTAIAMSEQFDAGRSEFRPVS